MTKRSLSVLTCLLAVTLTLTPMDVHAKKFGGGRSMGRSHSTARSQPSNLGSQSRQSASNTSGGFTSPARSQSPQYQTLSQSQSQYQSQPQSIPNQTTVNTGTTAQPSTAKSFMAGVAGGAVGGILAGSVMNALSDKESGQSAPAPEAAAVAAGVAADAATPVTAAVDSAAATGSAPTGALASNSAENNVSPVGNNTVSSDQQIKPTSGRGLFSMFNLMALLAFGGFGYAIFKKIQGRRTPMAANANSFTGAAAAGAATGSSQGQFGDGYRAESSFDHGYGGGFGQSDEVPFNLPPNFDLTGFLRRARDHYRTVQEAWNTGDMSTIREYVAPELYDHLANERGSLQEKQHTEVMFVDAEIVRADYHGGRAEISLRFTGRYRDLVEQVEEDINDVWHLEQAYENASWLIVGIE